MNIAFYTGASGLMANQSRMDVIGNNIANVNTSGYRPLKSSFEDLLYSKMNVNSADLMTGHGVKAVYVGIGMQPGTAIQTMGELDLALAGDGWFAVNSGSETLYTRNGNFGISLENGTAYLVDQNGYYVLDKAGQKISTPVPADSSKIDFTALTDKVGVYDFQYPEALTPAGSSCYRGNALTGKATPAAEGEYKIVSGYLEQSGVSLPDEMVDLISAQRGYQLSARVVQTADEVEQTVNSLRG